MAKINQEYLIFKYIFGKIASDGWQSIDLEKLSHECDFDVLNVTGGLRNKVDLLVAFSAFIDTTVNQSIDADLTLKEKTVFLDLASRNDWWLFFYHDPKTVAVKIKVSPSQTGLLELIDEIGGNG